MNIASLDSENLSIKFRAGGGGAPTWGVSWVSEGLDIRKVIIIVTRVQKAMVLTIII